MAIMDPHTPPLVFIFGLLGNIISFVVFLAPLPTFYRIYKRKSTEDFHSVPYLIALFSCMLWLYYASLNEKQEFLVIINIFGFVIECVYLSIFMIYAERDVKILTAKLFMGLTMGSFVTILLTTHYVIYGKLRVKVVGWICVSFSVSVFVAPLSIMAQVIRTRSVEFMPLSLSFSLTISAIVWFFYGLFSIDIHIFIPNIIGFILGLIQMTLYVMYRNGGSENRTDTMDPEIAPDTEIQSE